MAIKHQISFQEKLQSYETKFCGYLQMTLDMSNAESSHIH